MNDALSDVGGKIRGNGPIGPLHDPRPAPSTNGYLVAKYESNSAARDGR